MDGEYSTLFAQPWAQWHPKGFNNQQPLLLLEQPPSPSPPLNPPASALVMPHMSLLRPALSKVSIVLWDWFMSLYYTTHLNFLSIMSTEYDQHRITSSMCPTSDNHQKYQAIQSYYHDGVASEKSMVLKKEGLSSTKTSMDKERYNTTRRCLIGIQVTSHTCHTFQTIFVLELVALSCFGLKLHIVVIMKVLLLLYNI